MRTLFVGLLACACAAALAVADGDFDGDVDADAASQPLPKYNVDIHDTTVTGLSSGAFFAVQFHITFSSFVRGAAIFAGGPYHCAQGSLVTAEMQCMYAMPAPDPSAAVSTTNSRASSGAVDAVANLANAYVYLYSGTGDTTVHPPVMTALYDYYLAFVPSSHVVFDNTTASAHTQPTDDPVNTEACGVSQSPYISDCQYDGAGVAMSVMASGSGPLQPRTNGTLSGSIVSFDQTEFCPQSNCASISLADTGYAFVPVTCAQGGACALMLAFHGCEQNYAAVGMEYVQNSGYNKWADTNSVIVLYPQTISSEFNPANPNGCWDWWGYADANYDTNTGLQATVVRAMVKRITGQ